MTSLPLLPGPLLFGLVVSVRIAFMGQIDQFKSYLCAKENNTNIYVYMLNKLHFLKISKNMFALASMSFSLSSSDTKEIMVFQCATRYRLTDFNGMSTRLGLFYTMVLENQVYCTLTWYVNASWVILYYGFRESGLMYNKPDSLKP